jgi:hypothetical protein
MIKELTPILLGLTPTGVEAPHDPRREYTYTITGMYNLCMFLNIPGNTLAPLHERTIWLTPAFIEDLLIFHAFQVENCKAVYVTITVDAAGSQRTLHATDEMDLIHTLIKGTETEVYVNPLLFIPTH